VTVPLLVVNLVYLPVLLCRRLKHGLGKFYREIAIRPLVHVFPFAVCLIAGRLLFKTYPIVALGICAAGSAVLSLFYWRSVLPPSLKASINRAAQKVGRSLRIPGARKIAN
jgi:hypothetical protein